VALHLLGAELVAQSVINTDDLCVNLDSKTVEVNGTRVHRAPIGFQPAHCGRRSNPTDVGLP
jgi:hypothetical protein